MNKKDLQALTLVGPPRDNPELDPLAVLHLDNWLYMSKIFIIRSFFYGEYTSLPPPPPLLICCSAQGRHTYL